MSIFSVLKQIERNLEHFTLAEKKVANYVLENPAQVMEMTTKKLSVACQSSEAAIMRFCKRIGIQSFKVMKLELAKELHTKGVGTPELVDSPFQLGDDPKLIMQKVIFNSIQALQNTEKMISVKTLSESIDKLHQAERVYVYGVGGSAVVVRDFAQKLLRINVNVFRSDDSHLQMVMTANATKKDVIFVVSTSGKTKEVVDMLTIAKERNVCCILLTQNGPSPARRLADLVLTMSEEEHNIRIGTMTARIVQLAIIDALFVGLCSKRGQEIYERIIDTHQVVQHLKN
jgi:DNA-binding MurR/RpiR family transcriptional regulator